MSVKRWISEALTSLGLDSETRELMAATRSDLERRWAAAALVLDDQPTSTGMHGATPPDVV